MSPIISCGSPPLRWWIAATVFLLVLLVVGREASLLVQLSAVSPDHHDVQPSHGSKQQSLFHAIAPLFFPIDQKTGYIQLKEGIAHVVFDVGVFESDYVLAMDRIKDYATALVLIDPHPSSLVPVIKEALTVNENMGSRHIFWIPAALGDTEGQSDFHLNERPACSSLLPVRSFTGPCARDTATTRVLVFTLSSIVDLFPPHVASFHLKIDSEGADFMILKGAGESIRKFNTVIIECQRPNTANFRVGACQQLKAQQYMEANGFEKTAEDAYELQTNLFFVNKNVTSCPLPPLFRSPQLQRRKWYGTLP